jgi:hypothetical protein
MIAPQAGQDRGLKLHCQGRTRGRSLEQSAVDGVALLLAAVPILITSVGE